jgi:hypothetical protein
VRILILASRANLFKVLQRLSEKRRWEVVKTTNKTIFKDRKTCDEINPLDGILMRVNGEASHGDGDESTLVAGERRTRDNRMVFRNDMGTE